MRRVSFINPLFFVGILFGMSFFVQSSVYAAECSVGDTSTCIDQFYDVQNMNDTENIQKNIALCTIQTDENYSYRAILFGTNCGSRRFLCCGTPVVGSASGGSTTASVIGDSCGGGSGTCQTITGCMSEGGVDPNCPGFICCNGSTAPVVTPGGGVLGNQNGAGNQNSAGAPCDGGVMKAGICFPNGTGLAGLDSTPGGPGPVMTILTNLMKWLLGIIGVLGIVAFVISGVQYLVSSGDEELAGTAKRNMKYAMIGLAVALSGLIVINAIAGLTGAGGVTTGY